MKKIQTTDFDLYLINDCNYYVQFQLLEGKQSRAMILQDVVEPQTKLFVKTIERTAVNDFEFLHFQGFAFKDHFFDLKPCIDLDVRVKPTSFYKLHNFKETDYFYDPAMIVTLIEKDVYNFGQNIQAQDIQQALKAKESEPHTRERIQHRKKVKDEPLVVDLHATEILDSTHGLEPKDILNFQLEVFHKNMKAHVNDKGFKIIFIHGKGEGVLRKAVTDELRRKYKRCEVQDASFQQYGFGATLVVIH